MKFKIGNTIQLPESLSTYFIDSNIYRLYNGWMKACASEYLSCWRMGWGISREEKCKTFKIIKIGPWSYNAKHPNNAKITLIQSCFSGFCYMIDSDFLDDNAILVKDILNWFD